MSIPRTSVWLDSGFVAVGAVLLTGASATLVVGRARFGAEALLAGFGTLAVYALDRWLDPDRVARIHDDELQSSAKPHAEARPTSSSRAYRLGFLIGAGGVLTTAGFPNVASLTLLSGCAAATIAYLHPRGLKRWPGMKAATVAAVWTAVTIGLPQTAFGVFSPLSTLSRFFLLYAVALPFDLRDRDTDARRGRRTLAVLAGPTVVRQVMAGSLALAGVLACAARGTDAWPTLLACGWMLTITWKLARPRGPLFFSLAVDGTLHLLALALLIEAAGP